MVIATFPKKATGFLKAFHKTSFQTRTQSNLTHFSSSRSLSNLQSSKCRSLKNITHLTQRLFPHISIKFGKTYFCTSTEESNNNNNTLQPSSGLSKATTTIIECLHEEFLEHDSEINKLRASFAKLGFELDTKLTPPELKKVLSPDEAIYISFYDDAVAEELAAAQNDEEVDEDNPDETEPDETEISDGFIVTVARRCADGKERRLHLYCDTDKDGFQLTHIDVERPDGRKVPQDPNEVPRLRERFYGYLNDAGINDKFGTLMHRLAKATIHQADTVTWMKEMQLFFDQQLPEPQKEVPQLEAATPQLETTPEQGNQVATQQTDTQQK